MGGGRRGRHLRAVAVLYGVNGAAVVVNEWAWLTYGRPWLNGAAVLAGLGNCGWLLVIRQRLRART